MLNEECPIPADLQELTRIPDAIEATAVIAIYQAIADVPYEPGRDDEHQRYVYPH